MAGSALYSGNFILVGTVRVPAAKLVSYGPLFFIRRVDVKSLIISSEGVSGVKRVVLPTVCVICEGKLSGYPLGIKLKTFSLVSFQGSLVFVGFSCARGLCVPVFEGIALSDKLILIKRNTASCRSALLLHLARRCAVSVVHYGKARGGIFNRKRCGFASTVIAPAAEGHTCLSFAVIVFI